MKRVFVRKISISLALLFVSTTVFAEEPSSAPPPPEYGHDVRQVMSNRRGYQQAWVRVQNPKPDPQSKELPLEVTLPLCNKASVKKVDEYCALKDGSVAIVTAIKGPQVSVEKIDLSAAERYSHFAAVMRPTSSSRMPASALDVDVVCEASCPQMDFKNQCVGTGATKIKAYQDLSAVFEEKKFSECKNCNLKAVICDGKLFKIEQRMPGSATNY